MIRKTYRFLQKHTISQRFTSVRLTYNVNLVDEMKRKGSARNTSKHEHSGTKRVRTFVFREAERYDKTTIIADKGAKGKRKAGVRYEGCRLLAKW